MEIKDLYSNNLVDTDLKGKNKFQIIEEMISLMKNANMLNDHESALNDVIEREQYLSTGLENGVAIPHAKSDTVDELRIAFGISRQGIDFDTLDGKPANLIFMVLSPKDTSGPHIQLLAKIARNLKKEEVRKALLECNSSESVNLVFADFS